MLEGRSRNSVHETYIKADPSKLKKIYMKAMENVTINNEWRDGKTPSKPTVSESVAEHHDTLTSMTIKQLQVLSKSLQD